MILAIKICALQQYAPDVWALQRVREILQRLTLSVHLNIFAAN